MFKNLLIVLVLCLLALVSVDARRNRFDKVPGSFKGDPCDKLCPRRDGWDKCEIVKERGTTSVKCTDNRPDVPPRRG